MSSLKDGKIELNLFENGLISLTQNIIYMFFIVKHMKSYYIENPDNIQWTAEKSHND